MGRRVLVGIPLILFPSVCLLLALPLMSGLWPEILFGRAPWTSFDTMLLAISGVVAAAVLAAPGYLVAAFGEQRLGSLSALGRWWIRASLGAGVVAGLTAIPLTFFFASWLWIFPAGTFVACLALWYRSEDVWKSADAA